MRFLATSLAFFGAATSSMAFMPTGTMSVRTRGQVNTDFFIESGLGHRISLLNSML